MGLGDRYPASRMGSPDGNHASFILLGMQPVPLCPREHDLVATRVETLVTIFVQFNTAVRPSVSFPAAALLFCSPRSPGGGMDLGMKALLGAVVPLGVVLRV